MSRGKMKRVSKTEYDRFVQSYPNNLEYNKCAISDPPTCSYNDFTKGDWPQSVVAKSIGGDYFILQRKRK